MMVPLTRDETRSSSEGISKQKKDIFAMQVS